MDKIIQSTDPNLKTLSALIQDENIPKDARMEAIQKIRDRVFSVSSYLSDYFLSDLIEDLTKYLEI